MSGYDAFQGTQAPAPTPPDSSLSTLATLSCDTGIGVPVGTDVVVTTAAAGPATGSANYFLVGHSSPVAGARTALGRGANNNIRIAPIGCP